MIKKQALTKSGSVIEKRGREGEWGGENDETGATIFDNLLCPSLAPNAGRNIPLFHRFLTLVFV